MKLTKKLKAEILTVYHTYWDSYFNGDMRTFASLLHENVQIFGSSEGEAFTDKRSAMKFYKETMGQVVGKAGLRNRKIAMRPVGRNILVIEQSDFYVKIDGEWTFYGNGRISILMHKTRNGWKVIHEHGSLPDPKPNEGEQLSTKRIRAENRQLREAVKQRTADLERKNHELEVEAALERVRAVAMGMKNPADMLTVCKTIAQQMRLLGTKEIRNVQTAIFYPQRGTYMNFEYYAKHRRTFITETTYSNNRIHKAFAMKMLKGEGEFFTTHIKGRKVKEWIAYQKTTNVFIDKNLRTASSLSYYWYSLGPVAMGISSYAPLSDEHLNLFKRFRNVFELAYRRYLDIETAEAQAKEARIEAALERVRAVAMSMMKPDDLLKVCEVVFAELRSLGFSSDELRNTQIIINHDEKGMYSGYQYSDYIGAEKADVPYILHPVIRLLNERLRVSTSAFADIAITGKQLKDWKNFVNNFPQKHDGKLNTADELHYYFYSVGTGALGISSFTSLGEEKLTVLQRLRNVFQLSYQRYSDIAQAEAQAREAQIELALERVRARTMAMQRSDELAETASVLFQQFKELDKAPKMITIGIMNEEDGVFEFWVTDWSGSGSQVNRKFKASIDEPILLKKIYAAWKEHRKSVAIELAGNQLQRWIDYRVALSGVPDDTDYSNARAFVVAANFSKGILSVSSHEPQSPETIQVLERFAGVFDGTYTRFLDLQNAERQAREAQIEASLERIRSTSMAMQSSEELQDVLSVLFQQYDVLGIHPVNVFLTLFEFDKNRFVYRASGKGGARAIGQQAVDFSASPIWKEVIEKFRNEQSGATELIHYPKESLPGIFEIFHEAFTAVPEEYQVRPEDFPDGIYTTHGHNEFGYLGVNHTRPCTEEEKEIIARFAKEFGRVYQRFLDLQKAEAQAREAQIETSLERVRSKAMAMHNSGDLSATVSAVFSELRRLGVGTIRTGVALYAKNRPEPVYYATSTSQDESELVATGSPNPSSHPCLAEQYDAWLGQHNYFPVLSGEELQSYYKAISLQPSAHNTPAHHEEFGYYLPFSAGNFYAWALKPYTTEQLNILTRFKTIVDLTFRRYFDIEKAEAQAREAQVEAALERVRSRTLAMQKSDELAETAAVLFRQLIMLGIAPNRLYIGIIKDQSGDVEFWITDEDGSKVSSGFAANLNGNRSFRKMLEGWRSQQKSLSIDMQGEELQGYFQHLTSLHVPFKGGLSQKRRVQNIAYFSKGFIGIASPDPQPEETTGLLERFAAVFNLTFTRFNDLQIAEAHALQSEKDLIAIKEAKHKAEAALTELQATQQQLIQSEKMASLGELTAGIAHEIKNPLNFVNNFSEVSNELLDELKTEIQQAGSKEVRTLIDDLKKNLDKINQHGKRADAIVKGMLQHSRTGSGQKEPTDINALADEYLHLAYHGLRAKDKSFNAKFATALDPTIGKIDVVPQDFGRVILNLINNAFYAVTERKKLNEPGYEPTVTISTKRLDGRIEVRTKDNGIGIPPKVLDKIFQPFFTTKPAGEGTGLGLSLSYDIITKGHSGELKVETKEGEGTTFVIQLPEERHVT